MHVIEDRITRRACPNGFAIWMAFSSVDFDGEIVNSYTVFEDDDSYGLEFDGDAEAANSYYDRRVAELQATPNYDAQAAYDAKWGAAWR